MAGYTPIRFICPQAVTLTSSNRAQCRLTTLTEAYAATLYGHVNDLKCKITVVLHATVLSLISISQSLKWATIGYLLGHYSSRTRLPVTIGHRSILNTWFDLWYETGWLFIYHWWMIPLPLYCKCGLCEIIMWTRAVLSQGEPCDAAANFDTSNFKTAPCGFSATARISYTGLHQRPFKCWN